MERPPRRFSLKMKQETSINKLNDDILMKIFDHIDYDDKIKLRRTCRKWKHLLTIHLNRVKAIRLGHFSRGGYLVTSGLELNCTEHQSKNHRQLTGTLCNSSLLSMPADLETQCFSVNRYDFLHRALKQQSHQTITMLSLGSLHISYRLLIVLTHNLPDLEHLELINCASKFELNKQDIEQSLKRLSMIRNCDLIREAKQKRHWLKLSHLLVKNSSLLEEFCLSLILAIVDRSLVHLEIESHDYLTGEFLNYCAPQLKILNIKQCPNVQSKFVEDLLKIKKLLGIEGCQSDDSLR